MSTKAVPFALCVAVALAAGTVHAKPKARLEIAPGPTSQSAAEQAIASDPAAGIEHAVILVEETSVDSSAGTATETTYHRRAKILSSEGRDLGNVEILYNGTHGKLKTWWGRTILPDGRVLEVRQEDVESQTLIRGQSSLTSQARPELRAFKAALPGVVPGAVIDYGYTLVDVGFWGFQRVAIQQSWPVRQFRYRWKPFELYSSAYHVANADGLAIEAKQDRDAVLITATDVPALVEEPLMPPEPQVRAAATLYYFRGGESFDEYWNDEAKAIERRLKKFLSRDQPIRDMIASWSFPPDADPTSGLSHAYDWLTANVRDTELLSAEELESAETQEEEDARDTAKVVMERGEGSEYQLAALFVGFARALGAEANLVLVTDRRTAIWEPAICTTGAFDGVLVAVRTPGSAGDRVVLVDPGSGLPYGQIPWWFTGAPGLLTSPSGAKVVQIPAPDPRRNVAEVRATVGFSEDLERIVASWTRTGKGQVDLEERRYLRGLDPQARTERIEELCGSGPDVEVVSAEAPNLGRALGDAVLSCSIETEGTNLHEEIAEYRFAFGGLWLDALPELGASARRVHPIVFDFPRVHTARIDVSAPPGFEPAGEPPEKISIDTPYGRYRLVVTRAETGYRVERALGLLPLRVPREEFGALRAFFADVQQADETPLVFRRMP